MKAKGTMSNSTIDDVAIGGLRCSKNRRSLVPYCNEIGQNWQSKAMRMKIVRGHKSCARQKQKEPSRVWEANCNCNCNKAHKANDASSWC